MLTASLSNHRAHWQGAQPGAGLPPARMPPIRQQAGSTATHRVTVKNQPKWKSFPFFQKYYGYSNSPIYSRRSQGFHPNLPEPQPRSFEELHAERSYLLSSLQRENFKATEILRKIPPLEDTLMHSHVGHIRCKAKKRLGWLRKRIFESTNQEKMILGRLGMLTFEIHSRERWRQIESERREHEQRLDNQLALCRSVQTLQLNAGCPEFQPGGYLLPYREQTQQHLHPYGGYHWQPFPNGYALEPPTQPSFPDGSDFSNNDSTPEGQGARKSSLQRSSFFGRPCSVDNASVNFLATNTSYAAVPNQRRHSFSELPGNPTIWSDYRQDEKEEQNHEMGRSTEEYLGYYVRA